MSSTDWFVGSASQHITGPQHSGTYAIHALGFRGDDTLCVLVVCDVVDPQSIDCSSLHFHIQQHPLATVTAIIIPSGRTDSLCIADMDGEFRHRVVHAITDCVVDALTFGCPAVMRWGTHGIQWRKFDDHPIGTVLFRTPQSLAETVDMTHLLQRYGDPVVWMCGAGAVDTESHRNDTDVFAPITAESLQHVQWQRHTDGSWQIDLNQHHLLLVDGVCTPKLPAHVVTMNFTQALSSPHHHRIREVYGE